MIDFQDEIRVRRDSSSACLSKAGSENARTSPLAPAAARLRAAQSLLLIALTALPFLPSLRYQFVYDDDVQIVNNASIHSWDSVADFFTSTSFGIFDPNAASNFHYRPAFYLWLRINDAIFGMHPFGWHASALCLHLAATLLLFFLLCRHVEKPWIAMLAALVFGVYPAHIESVVWVSGATDPLAAVFLLGSLLLWLRRAEVSNPALQIGSLACFAGALLTKETAIVFPAIVFVYSLCGAEKGRELESASSRRIARAILDAAPFASVAALYFLARFAVLRNLPAQPLSLSARDALLSAPVVLLFYLRHLIWPFGLSLFYSFTAVTSVSDSAFWIAALILASLSACVWTWWRRTREPAIPAAVAWCLLPLLPVLDIALFQRDDALHDRYLYLPSIGLAIGVALVLGALFLATSRFHWPIPAPAPAVVLILALAISTVAQASSWRDNLSLYQHATEISPQNTIAQNNYGSELIKRGQLAEAEPIFQGVLRERPDYWLANYNFGYLNYRLKRFDVAADYLQRAIGLNPSDPDEYAYLGLTDYHENRFAESAAELRKAIAIKPAGAGYHVALALVLVEMQDFEGARSECLEELAYHPGNAAARAELSRLEQQTNRPK
jgi:protein O-mannosyl-transferase